MTTSFLAARAALVGITSMGLWGVSASAQQAPNLTTEIAQIAPFRVPFHQNDVAKTGDFPFPWTANVWDGKSPAEVALETRDGAKALKLLSPGNAGALQFYNWQPINLPAGRKYALTLDYQTAGFGALLLEGQNVAKTRIDLPAAPDWKQLRHEIAVPFGGNLNINLQNYGSGPNSAIWVRDIALRDAGATEIPVLKRGAQNLDVGSLYARQRDEWKAAGNASFVFGTQGERASDEFIAFANGTPVEAKNQPFKTARRIEIAEKPKQPWEVNFSARNTQPILKGDHLLVTFYARGTKKPVAVDDGRGAIVQPTLKADGFGTTFHNLTEITPDWERYWFKTLEPAPRDYAPGEVELLMMLGVKAQTVEVGGIAVMAFPQGSDISKLPRVTWNYTGREANAPWRKEAAARIERFRKGDLQIRVVDAGGKPVADAKVRAELKKHAFHFGNTVTGPQWFRTDADGQKYREIYNRYFNTAVLENDLKWKPYIGDWGESFNLENTLRLLRELKKSGKWTRGHLLVWPGFEHTPERFKSLHDKPEELRRVVRDHITHVMTQTHGLLDDWDVTNETEGNRQYMDLMGREEMLHWYKMARTLDPKPRLNFNEPTFGANGMEGGSFVPKEGENLRGWVDYLLKNGAPLGSLGDQAHGGRTEAVKGGGPESLWKFYDEFYARYKKPMLLTELDVNIEDDQDPEQLSFQADKLRDSLTIAFAHPAFDTIVQWGFWENAHWFPKAALWRSDWTIKPIGQAYVDLMTKTWHTDAQVSTAPNGTARVRGFKGDYEVSVTTRDGKTQTAKAQIGDKPGQIEVRLR